ncbi:MAG: YdcF family protein [bacterium]|nr:YdcF family protein [bacterium]
MAVLNRTKGKANQHVYDVIIVLGAAVWSDGQPSPTLRRRVAHAVDLFKTGKGRYLLVTGGLGKHPPCEAQVMYQLARSAEVPAARIVLEEQALSTFDSATRCIPICQQHGWACALLVTDGYHLPRALLTFRALGIQASGSAPQARRDAKQGCKRYLRETLALVWYSFRIMLRKIMLIKHMR